MQRHFVVRFKRHGDKNPELRWLSPEPAEQVVVLAENIPMAVRQFYREHAGQSEAGLTLLEIFEKKGGEKPALPADDFFRQE